MYIRALFLCIAFCCIPVYCLLDMPTRHDRVKYFSLLLLVINVHKKFSMMQKKDCRIWSEMNECEWSEWILALLFVLRHWESELIFLNYSYFICKMGIFYRAFHEVWTRHQIQKCLTQYLALKRQWINVNLFIPSSPAHHVYKSHGKILWWKCI